MASSGGLWPRWPTTVLPPGALCAITRLAFRAPKVWGRKTKLMVNCLPDRSVVGPFQPPATPKSVVAGPALKLKMRLVVGREAVGELTVKDPLEMGECDSGAIRPAFITQQNSRNPGTHSIGQITHGFARSGRNHDGDTVEYGSP